MGPVKDRKVEAEFGFFHERCVKERWEWRWECEQSLNDRQAAFTSLSGLKRWRKRLQTDTNWIYGLHNMTIQHEQRWAQAVVTWRVRNTIKAVADEDYLKRH